LTIEVIKNVISILCIGKEGAELSILEQLNNVYNYLLLLISDLLDSIRKKKVLIKMDLRWGTTM